MSPWPQKVSSLPGVTAATKGLSKGLPGVTVATKGLFKGLPGVTVATKGLSKGLPAKLPGQIESDYVVDWVGDTISGTF